LGCAGTCKARDAEFRRQSPSPVSPSVCPPPHSRVTTQDLVNVLHRLEDAHREWISKLLHDEIGQTLSAVGLQVEVLRLDFKDAVPGVGLSSVRIQETLEEALSAVRQLSTNLSSDLVGRVGLRSAIERLAVRFQTGFTGKVRLAPGRPIEVDGESGRALYRIADLGLLNAIEIRGARRIAISLKKNRKVVRLEIRDDGECPSPPKELRPEAAIVLVEHCAQAANLRFGAETVAGGGFCVWAEAVSNVTR
jgi:signal transduction histidine kinase